MCAGLASFLLLAGCEGRNPYPSTKELYEQREAQRAAEEANGIRTLYENWGFGVYAICDKQTGNLVYATLKGGVSVVLGGCDKPAEIKTGIDIYAPTTSILPAYKGKQYQTLEGTWRGGLLCTTEGVCVRADESTFGLR